MAGAAAADAVQARLRAAAGDGVLRFDRFVEIALYSPGGFYDSAALPLGTEGSFYTAAHTTPLFGATLARRLAAERERLGVGSPFRVVELGPGDGTLALDAARALPPGGARWEWTFVERSARLRTLLADRIAREAGGTPVTFDFMDALSARGTFAGAVVANEFLDALPFRRRVRRDGMWRELGVRWSGGRWAWAEDETAPGTSGEPIADADEGTRYEYLERAEGFLREVADHLVAGAAIFLDYGAGTEELLRGHPGGTLAAVRNHRSVDPLEAPGTADVSAFVDFTRVRAAAARAGLSERAFRTQSEALGAWGFSELLNATVQRATGPEASVKIRLAAKNLLFGFGTFHALELEAPRAAVPTS